MGHAYYGEPVVVVRPAPDDPPEVIVRHADGRHWAMAATGITSAVASPGPAPTDGAPVVLDLARLRQIARLLAVLRPA